jgi:hypothetical protein
MCLVVTLTPKVSSEKGSECYRWNEFDYYIPLCTFQMCGFWIPLQEWIGWRNALRCRGSHTYDAAYWPINSHLPWQDLQIAFIRMPCLDLQARCLRESWHTNISSFPLWQFELTLLSFISYLDTFGLRPCVTLTRCQTCKDTNSYRPCLTFRKEERRNCPLFGL